MVELLLGLVAALLLLQVLMMVVAVRLANRRPAKPAPLLKLAGAGGPPVAEYEFLEYATREGVDASVERMGLSAQGWELMQILPGNGLNVHVLRRRVG